MKKLPKLNLLINGTANDDVLIGTVDPDTINGLAGNDTLIGGGGADTLFGGTGDDVYRVEEAGDAVVENVGEGFDRVYAVVSYALAAGSEVELLSAINPDSTEAMDLTGNEFANTLIGTNGANVLIGGAGLDVLYGRAGNDIYRVEETGDVIIENVGEGFDAVYAVANYTLNDGCEVELLSAINPNSTGAMDLTGNNFANTLIGTAGANVLIGGGGLDVLAGGAGNDIYRVEETGDVVLESTGGGFDAVYAVGDYTLNDGCEVELLSAINPNSTAAMNLTGNNLANTLIGTAGVNVLIGGLGLDVLAGGAGNDIYRVEETGDVVLESTGGGFDSVYAVGSYTLNDGCEVELLSAIDPNANLAMDLTGNNLANTIIGNAAGNTLIGGLGDDVLAGKLGNDVYRVEDAGDVVLENAGEGIDSVYVVNALASYTLRAGSEIELLSAVNPGGNNAMDLTGNEFANVLIGTAGVNVLDGKAGADTLIGGAGADSFAFTTALGGGNVDQVNDFTAGVDKILLDDAVFAGIGAPGAFSAGAFVTGASAADADDRIIYNSLTGQLFYDADGNGAGAAVQFATLNGNPVLSVSDFQVI